VALFSDPILPQEQKSTWGAVLVAIITITTFVTLGIAVFGKMKTLQEVIVPLPTDKVAKLTPEQQALVFRMLFNFSLHQRLPVDIPVKTAKKMLDPVTYNKLWRWRKFGQTTKSLPTQLKMTIGSTQPRDSRDGETNTRELRIPSVSALED
jgi:hypothetical protein